MKEVGFSLAEMRDAGYAPSELKAAGFSLAEVKDAGSAPSELKKVSFTLAEKSVGKWADASDDEAEHAEA